MQKIIIDKKIEHIFDLLAKHGKTYIVGGYIRDSILGITTKDIDIATSLSLKQVSLILKDYDIKVKNAKYEISTFKLGEYKIEIARLREDIGVLDGRNPLYVSFACDILKDLKRRDFTINSFAYDKNQLINIHNGINDLENKKIRVIGEAKQRFLEDKIRILRAFRFMAKLDFDFDSELEKAILELAKSESLFNKFSKDRLIIEFNKIITSKYAHKALKKMYELNVLRYFIKEFNNKTFNKDVFYIILENYEKMLKKYKNIDLEMAYAVLFCFSAKKNVEFEKLYESDSALIFDTFSKKYLSKSNSYFIIKNLILYHSLIYRKPSFAMLKRVLLDLVNNKNVCKLLHLIDIIYDIDYRQIEKLLVSIQTLYIQDEPLFLSDIDIINSDLYNLALDSKKFLEMKLDSFKAISNGEIPNSKYEILERLLIKNKTHKKLLFESCAGAIVYTKEFGEYRFLIIRGSNEGGYSFPKGHIEKGEKEQQTAIREVKEETNIDIEIVDSNKFKHFLRYIIYPNIFKEVTVFLGEAKNTDILIDEVELSTASWLTYKEALETLTFSHQRELLKKAMLYIY